MAERAGIQHVRCRSVGCCDDQWQRAAPRDRVGGIDRMAILAPVGKSAFGDVESRVAPRATGRRIGVASLAVDKVRLGSRAVKRGIRERYNMGSCRIGMTERVVKASRLGARRQGGIGRRRPVSQMAEAADIGVRDIRIGMCPCSASPWSGRVGRADGCTVAPRRVKTCLSCNAASSKVGPVTDLAGREACHC